MDLSLAMLFMSTAVLLFTGLYMPASRCSRMRGSYSQAISAVQHKVDQLRAVGYGRLTFTELRTAGIVDAAPASGPYRFDGADALAESLPSPVGTITLTPVGTDLMSARVLLRWGGTAVKAMEGSHEATVLIANQ